jgi:hypothetical protein
MVAEAQRLVAAMPGVSSCRFVLGDDGKIKQVDLVVTTTKSPALVARDVESMLAAELNMDVEYKKINVVLFESSTAADREPELVTRPTDTEGMVTFPIEEFASRFEFQRVNVFQSPEGVHAEIELARDGVEIFGTSRSKNLSEPYYRVVAEATLNAITELLDDHIRLCLSDVAKIEIGGEHAIVVKVDLLRNRDAKSLAGCSLYSGNMNQTTVFATLAAVNRVLGVLGYKTAIEYRIE